MHPLCAPSQRSDISECFYFYLQGKCPRPQLAIATAISIPSDFIVDLLSPSKKNAAIFKVSMICVDLIQKAGRAQTISNVCQPGRYIEPLVGAYSVTQVLSHRQHLTTAAEFVLLNGRNKREPRSRSRIVLVPEGDEIGGAQSSPANFSGPIQDRSAVATPSRACNYSDTW